MHAIRIDRSKPLCDEPNCGHNRYHPDIAAAAEIGEGEEIALETRDALDGQITPTTTVADFAALDAGKVHPLTGPVFVKGAQPGDILEIEFTDIIPQPTAFSAIMPGLGFLRDVMTEPFLVHWELKDNWATSAQLPGVRIPGAPFMGVSAVAPTAEQLAAWTAREQRVIDAGGFALPPDAAGAVPAGPCGLTGLRTLPPRENGGNFDVKQLTKGAKLYLPVFKEGALFSTGDAHFAQGDGEVCVTAVEMGATAVVRFKLHKGLATRRKFISPVFSRTTYFADPALRRAGTVPRRHGHADQRRRRDRGREPHARLPQRGAEHDGAVAGTRIQPPAGVCDLQRRGRSADLQRGRCAELRRVGAAAGGDLRRVRLNAQRHGQPISSSVIATASR